MRRVMACLAGMMMTMGAMAQSGAVQTSTVRTKGVDDRTADALATQAKTLMEEARKTESGNVAVTLEKYPAHSTMLSVRVKSGGAEVHADYNDIFIALDGEATVITGGTVVDPKEVSPGETRGAKVEGGVPTVMHKGDVMHISPGVPHQTMVAAGKTFTYYVVKIAAPKAAPRYRNATLQRSVRNKSSRAKALCGR